MLLSDFLQIYVNEHATGVSESTLLCYYRPAITTLKRYLKRDPLLSDCNDETINAWTNKRLSEQANALTIRQRRSAILALWRAAFLRSLVPANPEKLRKIPRPQLVIVAWTRDELSQLLEAIAQSKFAKKTMPQSSLNKALFFRTLALAGYATGLRLGDLLSIERDWIRVDGKGFGYLTIVQNKTKIQKTSRIEPSTMLLIDQLMSQQPSRRLIWPLNCRRPFVYRNWNKLVEKAKIRSGTFKWIRRSGTTHVEQQSPGCGYRHAGHSDSRVTMMHYIDRSQLNEQIVAPDLFFRSELESTEIDRLQMLWPTLPEATKKSILSILASRP